MQARTHVDTTPLPVNGTLQVFTRASKRLFDLVFAFLGLILLSPMFILIAWRIRRDSPGPVFYNGQRGGLNGKVFLIHKFRTMHEDEASYQGPPVTAQDDPRITRLGRWLRETKLNELPQLWNVLKGEMSLVGPRPEDPAIVKEWLPDVRRDILSVRPGITSPASVLYRREEDLLKGGRPMDTYLSSILPSKLRLDQLYVRHSSFWLDLDILFWTAILLFPRLGSFNPPERMLFIGPFSRFVTRYLSWFIIDTIVSLVSIMIAGLFFRSFAPLDVGWPRAIGIAMLYSLLFSITCAILKVNTITWSEARGEDILPLVPATFLATVLAVVTITFFRNPEQVSQPYVPYGMIFMASLLSFIGFVFVRFRKRIVEGLESRWLARWSNMSITRERVLVVGGGESGQIANALLTTSTYGSHFQVIGYVDDDMYKLGTRIQGLEVLGMRENIPALVKKHDIGILIFAIHNISVEERKQFLDVCTSTSARTIIFPDVPAALNTLVSVEANGEGPFLQVENLFEQFYEYHTVEAPPVENQRVDISASEFDQWLEEFALKTASGDLEGLQKLIQERRALLHAVPILKQDSGEN